MKLLINTVWLIFCSICLATTKTHTTMQYLRQALKRTNYIRTFSTKNNPHSADNIHLEEQKQKHKPIETHLDTSNLMFVHALIEQQNTLENVKKNTQNLHENCYENPEHYPNYNKN